MRCEKINQTVISQASEAVTKKIFAIKTKRHLSDILQFCCSLPFSRLEKFLYNKWIFCLFADAFHFIYSDSYFYDVIMDK